MPAGCNPQTILMKQQIHPYYTTMVFFYNTRKLIFSWGIERDPWHGTD